MGVMLVVAAVLRLSVRVDAHSPIIRGDMTEESMLETEPMLSVETPQTPQTPPETPQTPPGLQIRGSKFQSLNSNFRELELANFLGLFLGCIEAKFCK